jgi:triosephosphate isomerase
MTIDEYALSWGPGKKSKRMGRRKIAAGNWKMHLSLEQARRLASTVAMADRPKGVDVFLGIPSVFLHPVSTDLQNSPGMYTGAQNCHQAEAGAYTGEVSASMVSSAGGKFVILGHSERRELFGETDQIIEQKIRRALSEGLEVVFCCGEPLEQRESGQHKQWVERQMRHALFSLSPLQMQHLIIAYEPIWAIGTGKTASPEQAGEMHQFIRKEIRQAFGDEIADGIPILYGGSVKPQNAHELFSQEDVDGGLVGGASLEADGFLQIVHALSK